MKKFKLKKQTLFVFKNSKKAKTGEKDPTTTGMTFTVSATSYF
ncbi:hypothetical protein [Olivibacter sp. SDN3]|nr:hypothetical protein [Olivibacter sp. SDN3]